MSHPHRPRALAPFTFLAALSLTATACGPSPYLEATGVYAKSLSASVEGFSPAFETAVDLCYRNAQLEHLQHRLQRDWDWGQRTPLGDLFLRGGKVKVQRPGSAEIALVEVNARCEGLATADALVRKGLDGLDAYAQALLSVDGKLGADGARLGDLAKSGSDLAGSLTTSTSTVGAVAGAVAPVGQALGALARALSTVIVTGRLKEVVAHAHPEVVKILHAARAYVQATRLEAQDVELATLTVLNSADLVVAASLAPDPGACADKHAPRPAPAPAAAPAGHGKPPAQVEVPAPALEQVVCEAVARQVRRPPSAPDVLALYDLAARQRRHLQGVRRSLDAFAAILDELAEAENAIAAGAAQDKADDKALEGVPAAAGRIVKQLDTLRTLASQKE